MRFTVFKANQVSCLFLSLLLVMMSSCSLLQQTTVRNHPIGKPFVFANKVNLKGNISKDEKIRLTTELDKYWDDSLQVNKLQQIFIFNKIKNPPVFDSINIGRSVILMNAYLNSQGYYYANFKDSVRIDSVKDQIRTTVAMDIEVGKNITIDSVSFELGDSTLQKLTNEAASGTLLKKGTPYTVGIIGAELTGW